MQLVTNTPAALIHPLATAFDQWSQQVQELYKLYYDLLVLRDRTTCADVGNAAEAGQKQLMIILTNALEDLKNAPPAADQEALGEFLAGHFRTMKKVSEQVRAILDQEASVTT
ncbi:hypothetical protein [Tellurirhabdus rosea]|uniref:hypothetical protein n=1 Tax=Tellurirhabdus rosea TaxID=2674997 RepID=UPI002256A85B|nr:hypothetical protein [Tellurirhabdus rosea]